MTTNWIKLQCIPRLRYIKETRVAQLESRSSLELSSPDLELNAASSYVDAILVSSATLLWQVGEGNGALL